MAIKKPQLYTKLWQTCDELLGKTRQEHDG